MTARPVVYLLGSEKFYNESMKYVIQKEMGFVCEVLHPDDLLSFEFKCCSHSETVHTTIYLLDYQWDKVKAFWSVLAVPCIRKMEEAKVYLALYNVRQESRIEKKALQKGLMGVFYEDDGLELIKTGLSNIIDEVLWFSRKSISEVLLNGSFDFSSNQNKRKNQLTNKEKEILQMIIDCKTNASISRELNISISTVKTHVYNIYKKINVSNRLEAARWSLDHM